jgi:hypothetical protein
MIDEALIDNTILRWQAFSGLEATHGRTGATFADTEED